jgi:membrane-associated phospholipid phosphatase
MAFFYFSYYLMIPGMGLFLWFRKKERFSHFVFTSALCFYFFYWLFSLIPSAGPQYYLYEGFIEWKGVFFGPLLTHLLQAVECPTGAFPSSHVGVALIVCGFAWRQGRRPGLLLLILLTGLAASILYGGPHYFLDLPCGLAVGFVFLGCAETCARRINA